MDWVRPKSDEERIAELEARVKALELRPQWTWPVYVYPYFYPPNYVPPCIPSMQPYWWPNYTVAGAAGAYQGDGMVLGNNINVGGCQPAYAAGNQLTFTVM
jgi:hypothetical protein